ncbi:MAG: FGGY family carbohydrate kinase [Eubacteriales bacterium]|nr:FGGY family carbohydrate kinase [Eubacteriales bacterium]
MQYIGVDLGSTNIKAAAYGDGIKLINRLSVPVEYDRTDGKVEFDAEEYFEKLVALLNELSGSEGFDKERCAQITFTGQAETLVVVGKDGKAMMPAISWMDERSVEECEELAAIFSGRVIEATTGQQAVLPTWPATKILWLKHNRPEIYDNAETYMLLKDYIVFKLTGVKNSDMSIATFSFYFDIYEKKYWKEMLDAIGITEAKLPPLAEPNTVAGTMLPEVAAKAGLSPAIKVNNGTLDHFTGMIGTGNVELGGVSLSTGTVMALATMAKEPVMDRNCGVAMHYGFLPDTHVMLPVAESGGVSLEWYRRTFMPEVDYKKLNEVLDERTHPTQVIFLPYIVGTNAPEFDTDASGMVYGLRQENDAFDVAAAVMEGVAFVLRKNCESMNEKGAAIDHIIATGGGAKSNCWCQMQADITGLPVVRPAELEAACLGAAIIGAVSEGEFASFKEAGEKVVAMDRRFEPHANEGYERNYKRFNQLYAANLLAAAIQ